MPLREVPRSRNEAKLGGLLNVVVFVIVVVVVVVDETGEDQTIGISGSGDPTSDHENPAAATSAPVDIPPNDDIIPRDYLLQLEKLSYFGHFMFDLYLNKRMEGSLF